MANDGSLVGVSPQFAFDLDTQKGMMALLAAVRASTLSAEQKNELRDLAFLYTNGGKDQSVRITLQQKVMAYDVQPLAPVVPPAPVIEQPVHPFGASRPAPTFSFTTPVVPTAPAEPQVSASKPTPPVESPLEPIPAPIPEAAVAQVMDAGEPFVSPQPIEEPITTPSPILDERSAEVAPVATGSSAPTVVTESVPAMAEAVVYDQAVAMQRIKEIKAVVNEKVGNPVNLVDIDNAVGREYMAALLDAMKKISSGASVSSAMKRLEDSFVMVERTLEAHQTASEIPSEPMVAPEAPQATDKPEVEQIPVSQPQVVQPIIPQEPVPVPIPSPVPLQEQPLVTPEPILESLPVEASSVESVAPVPEPIAVPQPTPIPTVSTQPNATPLPLRVPVHQVTGRVPVQDPEYVVSVREDIVAGDAAKKIPVGTPVTPLMQTPLVEIKHKEEPVEDTGAAWGPATDTLSEIPRPVSVADSKQKIRTIDELPTAAEVSVAGPTGDPLFTKEVDDGMQQLLSEWPIFKKSGLFGTGPKGKNHPLFLKIAALQIPLLLAGRFEGATQEIKQSITDYMNGWRYEQGIIYEQGETFEHYLRRVIRHILDLQKRR